MENKSENRRRLLGSLEMRCVIRDVIIVLVFMGFVALLDRDRASKHLILLTCVPFLVFYLIRTINILRRPGSYRFYKAKLTQPHRKFPMKAMYFTVVLEDGDGTRHIRDTHAIFACHGLVGPLMEDYVNRTVTIAHNPDTGIVVVIG